MDFVNKLTGGSKDDQEKQQQQQRQGNEQKTSGGGIMGKLNSMAGGGKESEKNEDALDKGQLPVGLCLPVLPSSPPYICYLILRS